MMNFLNKRMFLVVVTATLSLAAFAYSSWTDSDTGLTWKYSISDGKATVGSGYYSTPAVPASTSGNIAIPDVLGKYPVEKIAKYAFRNCASLTGIAISTNVTEIGDSAFSSCSGLTEISIPCSVTNIGSGAFSGCKALTNVVLSSGIKSISSSMFSSCKALTGFAIPESVTNIGLSAFASCTGLKDMVVPAGVREIGTRAFAGCSSLTNLVLSDGMTSIPSSLCDGCAALSNVVISAGATNIGDCAFYGCSALTNVVIPRSVRTIGYRSFYNCKALQSVTLPDGVASVGSQAFYNCPAIDFEGRPPEGLFNAMTASTVAIRYNRAYAAEWAVALASGSRMGYSQINATAYEPEGWVAPEDSYEGSFAVAVDAKLLSDGRLRMAWLFKGELPSTPVRCDVIGWRESGETAQEETLISDAPTQYGDYTLDARMIAQGTCCRLFAVRYQFEDGSTYTSEKVDLRSVIPVKIAISITGGLDEEGVVGIECHFRGYYEDANGGAELIEGDAPQGWPWDGYGSPGELVAARNSDGCEPSSVQYWESLSSSSSFYYSDGRFKYSLDAYAVAMGNSWNMFAVRYEYGYDSDSGTQLYLCSNALDLREKLPQSISLDATGTMTNGVVYLSWKPKAQYATGVGDVPAGWPWNSNWPEIGGVRVGETADDYSFYYDWPYSGCYPEIETGTNGCGTARIALNPADVAMGCVYDRYQVRFRFYSMDDPYSSGENYITSNIIDFSGTFPMRIVPVVSGVTMDGERLRISWEYKGYTTWDGTVECAIPEGWPWTDYCHVEVYGQNRSEYAGMLGEWMAVGEALQDSGVVEVYQNAYEIASGTAPTVYSIRMTLDTPMTTSGYTTEIYGPEADFSNLFPGCIRIEATGRVENGTVYLSWAPHAYVSKEEGAAECELPEGWPWCQLSATRVVGLRADGSNSEPSYGTPIEGYDTYFVGTECFIPLSAYEVAEGMANNMFEVVYEMMPSYNYQCYSYSGYLTSSRVDLRSEIPGCIRIEATGKMEYGMVTLNWEPHAYESTAEGAAECAMPEGWPWGQETVSLQGVRADGQQTSDWYCWMPVYGFETLPDCSGENSISLPLSAYEVAMGQTYNMYRIHYELMSMAYSYSGCYSGSGSLDSTTIDFREQLPGCIRIEASGSFENGNVNLTWTPHAYVSSEDGAAECDLPDGWPWDQATARVCGLRVTGSGTDSEYGMPIYGLDEFAHENTCTFQLRADELILGTVNNMYEITYDFHSNYSSYGGYGGYYPYCDGMMTSTRVDLRDKIPYSMALVATAAVDAGVVTANWSVVAYYGEQNPTNVGEVPAGWPWDDSLDVRLNIGTETVSEAVTGGVGVISCVLSDPCASCGSVDIGWCYGSYALSAPLLLETAEVKIESAHGWTEPYALGVTYNFVKGALLSVSAFAGSGEAESYELAGWKLTRATESAGTGGTCAWTLAGDTTLTWLWNYTGTEPTVADDPGATVSGDEESGYTIKPSENSTNVVVTIPSGVAPNKVTVEVSADVGTITPNGATLKIVKGSNDITSYLDIPAVNANGVIDLKQATVKEEIVLETLDTEKGAVVEISAESPTLTTAETKPGLTYTLIEGTTLEGMTSGDSKVGDGKPWTPDITVKGGTSGFYTIDVSK